MLKRFKRIRRLVLFFPLVTPCPDYLSLKWKQKVFELSAGDNIGCSIVGIKLEHSFTRFFMKVDLRAGEREEKGLHVELVGASSSPPPPVSAQGCSVSQYFYQNSPTKMCPTQ